MDPDRGASSIVALCLQLCLLGSAVSGSSSLWGQKAVFEPRPAPVSGSSSLWGKKAVFEPWPALCLWQLKPPVPPRLQELSACLLLRRRYLTAWTGFVYKAPGAQGGDIELGLGGNGGHLVAWLFGEEWRVDLDLPLYDWHTVCLTWSGHSQALHVYVNGSSFFGAAAANGTLVRRLAPYGTLTLGVSHNVVQGALKPEDGNGLMGEIGRFQMWSREWSAEEMQSDRCADGDVARWDLGDWSAGCPPVTDASLRCAWSTYKIKMLTFITRNHKPVIPLETTISLENITINWLKTVFPPNLSVSSISVSPLSQHCRGGHHLVSLDRGQTQGSKGSVNSSADECFDSEIYVTVDLEADIEQVQTGVSDLLTSPFSNPAHTLVADNNSLSVRPVESVPGVTEPVPTVSLPTMPPGDRPSVGSGVDPTHCFPAAPTNMLTTGESANSNSTTGVKADTFFKASLTVSITGAHGTLQRTIETWLKETLQVNKTMTILNLKVDGNRFTGQNNRPMTSGGRYKECRCTFQIQVFDSRNVQTMKEAIGDALNATYVDGTTILKAVSIVIQHIVPANCPESTIWTVYGTYAWPETFPQRREEMRCVKPGSRKASRLCALDGDTDTTSWRDAVMTKCKAVVSIPDLDKINVTAGNAADIVTIIQDLVEAEIAGSVEDLSNGHLQTVIDKLQEVVQVTAVTPPLGSDIIDILGEILASASNIHPVARDILALTDSIGNKMEFPGASANMTAPSLALSLVNVDPQHFKGLTFGVTSFSTGSDPEIFINESFVSEPFLDAVATISLPSALQDFLPLGDNNRTRLQFHFYGSQDLFKDPEITRADSNWTLNTYVVSASVNNSRVSDLTEQRVVVTFRHRRATQPDDKVKCVYWDFQKSGGQGGWNSSGCVLQRVSPHQTSCHCDHLTNFGVLLDVSRTSLGETDSRILTVISYLGCGISSLFLGITLLTYTAFEKLRRDYPSKILMNLSLSLLGLNLWFLLDSWVSSFSSPGLCVFTAASLHYFLLASFTWMGLEAVHMYFALVKVFNVYVRSYILKFCAVGWGVPLVVVSLVLAIDMDAYGSAVYTDSAVETQDADAFCWIQSDLFFYVTVVSYVLLVLLFNLSVFVVVLIQIRNMRTNKPAGRGQGSGSAQGASLHDLRAGVSLTVLLGLTWPIGFLALGPARVALLYLFTFLNSLQGFFIFVFHCLMKENVRKQWRIHLCVGRFRLSDHSDWSRSKANQLVHSHSDRSVNTSSSRKISDSST